MENKAKVGIAVGMAAVGAGIVWLLSKKAVAVPPIIYTCPYCGATFATYAELLAHIELEHPEEPPPPPSPIYTCPYCGATFATYAELLAHIELEHPEEPPPPPTTPAVETSSIIFDEIGGNLVNGLYNSPTRLTKREFGSAPNESQTFSFSLAFRNKLDYEVWLDVYFAFGNWVNGIFTPYSPQGSLFKAYYPEGGVDTKDYIVKNNYMWLGASGTGLTGRNMSPFYGKGYFLIVPPGGEAETGFDNVYINKHACSIYPPNYSAIPLLALYSRTLDNGVTVIDEGYMRRSEREPLPPLDLDIGVLANIYKYRESVGPKGPTVSLDNTGMVTIGGLLNAAHITNAWGSWEMPRDWPGRITYYKWEWVRCITPPALFREGVYEPCPAPDWWQ